MFVSLTQMAFVFLSGMVLSAGQKVCRAKWWLCHVLSTSMTSITKVSAVPTVSKTTAMRDLGGMELEIPFRISCVVTLIQARVIINRIEIEIEDIYRERERGKKKKLIFNIHFPPAQWVVSIAR